MARTRPSHSTVVSVRSSTPGTLGRSHRSRPVPWPWRFSITENPWRRARRCTARPMWRSGSPARAAASGVAVGQPGGVEQAAGGERDAADGGAGAGVGPVAVDLGRHVDVDEVALAQPARRRRDAVGRLVVDADARRRGEADRRRRRPGAVAGEDLATDGVELGGGDAGGGRGEHRVACFGDRHPGRLAGRRGRRRGRAVTPPPYRSSAGDAHPAVSARSMQNSLPSRCRAAMSSVTRAHETSSPLGSPNDPGLVALADVGGDRAEIETAGDARRRGRPGREVEVQAVLDRLRLPARWRTGLRGDAGSGALGSDLEHVLRDRRRRPVGPAQHRASWPDRGVDGDVSTRIDMAGVDGREACVEQPRPGRRGRR